MVFRKSEKMSLAVMVEAFAISEKLELDIAEGMDGVGNREYIRFRFSNATVDHVEIIWYDEVRNLFVTLEGIRKRVTEAFKSHETYSPFNERMVKTLKDRILECCKSEGLKPIPKIKKVHFSGPCTIVLWTDNTKTIVRAENEVFDPEKGLAMAIAKKVLGTNASGSNYYDEFKKWCEPYYEVEDKVDENDIVTLEELFETIEEND